MTDVIDTKRLATLKAVNEAMSHFLLNLDQINLGVSETAEKTEYVPIGDTGLYGVTIPAEIVDKGVVEAGRALLKCWLEDMV